MTKRSRESLLPSRGHVGASFSMNRRQTGELGGSPTTSRGHTPGLSPPQASLRNPASLRSPQLPRLHRSAAPGHHGHYEGGTFSQLFPHNGHTRGLLPPSTVTLLGSPFLLSLRPGLGLPSLTTTESQSGTHPKASRLELTGGKGGVAAAAVGEHSRGGGVMVSCPSRFSLDLSHCAKPNLPGTKMVSRKLWRKRISPPDVIWVRGRTKQTGRACRLSNGKVSLSQGWGNCSYTQGDPQWLSQRISSISGYFRDLFP